MSASEVELAQVARLPALTEFYLQDSRRVTNAGIAHLRSMTRLIALGLEGEQISDAGMRHLEGLSLQRLFLNGTKVTDQGLASVAKISSLQGLWLHGTAITDRGLAQLEALTSLQYLSLRRTAIGDAGIPSLKDLQSLQVLHLFGTAVTDKGLKQIREALPNCRVELKQ